MKNDEKWRFLGLSKYGLVGESLKSSKVVGFHGND